MVSIERLIRGQADKGARNKEIVVQLEKHELELKSKREFVSVWVLQAG